VLTPENIFGDILSMLIFLTDDRLHHNVDVGASAHNHGDGHCRVAGAWRLNAIKTAALRFSRRHCMFGAALFYGDGTTPAISWCCRQRGGPDRLCRQRCSNGS
jgi:hypothetical protein